MSEQLGPTVHEAAVARMREIQKLITQLQAEKIQVVARASAYANSTMLESERIASEAEPFQVVQLSDKQD